MVTAHLQAGYDARAIGVRAMQLADLKALIDSVGAADRPFVVCGDFNINGLTSARGDAEYQCLAAARGGDIPGAAAAVTRRSPHVEGMRGTRPGLSCRV